MMLPPNRPGKAHNRSLRGPLIPSLSDIAALLSACPFWCQGIDLCHRSKGEAQAPAIFVDFGIGTGCGALSRRRRGPWDDQVAGCDAHTLLSRARKFGKALRPKACHRW